VINNIGTLIKLGLLKQDERRDKFGHKKSPIYYLQLDKNLQSQGSHSERTESERTESERTLYESQGPHYVDLHLIYKSPVESPIKENTNPIGLVQKKKKRSSLLPDDFAVTERHRELASQNGWPSPDEEVEAFKDHHGGKGTLMVNWDLAFNTWLRNAKKFKKLNGGNPNVRQKSKAEIMWDSCATRAFGFDPAGADERSEKIINPQD
jgi:hypothetical protein